MKKITTFILAGSITILSCKTSDLGLNAPACIENKIEVILNNDVSNPPTQVWRWDVDGKTYYYITSDCCDQYNNLFDNKCELVCAPDGGFTGKGDGKCPDFTNEIVKTLIWQDKRN